MGNTLAVGSDLTIDVASSIIEKIENSKNEEKLSKFEEEKKILTLKNYYKHIFEAEHQTSVYFVEPRFFYKRHSSSESFLIIDLQTLFYYQIDLDIYLHDTFKIYSFFPNENRLYISNDQEVFGFDLQPIEEVELEGGDWFSDTGLKQLKQKQNLHYKAINQISLERKDDLIFPPFFFKDTFAIPSRSTTEIFDIQKGKNIRTITCFGNIKKTLNDQFIYQKSVYWKEIDGDNEIRFTNFESVSNDGMYVLATDIDKCICRIYQTVTLRNDVEKKIKDFDIEISMINSIRFADFSYDSNFVLILCDNPLPQGFEMELFVYSIVLRKFVFVIPKLRESTITSFENYLIIGFYSNGFYSTNFYEIKLPSFKPDIKRSEKGSNIHFFFQ